VLASVLADGPRGRAFLARSGQPDQVGPEGQGIIVKQTETDARSRRELLNQRLDFMVTPSMRQALVRLAERNVSSISAEARRAIVERLQREAT
jgi:hypothetical protein